MNAYQQAMANQRAAAAPDRSVFVTANAGSGKTKVLVDRIVRLLMAGGAPDSFLCITFTKAAAAEMQRRLFERLGAWCIMDDAKLSQQLVDLGERAPDANRLAHARALFARALESPGGLKIQTIHAFCERILARFPVEAGVAPGFVIADDVRQAELVRRAWATALANGDASLDAALTTLSTRFDPKTFESFLAGLAMERTAIRAFVRRRGGRDGAVEALRVRHGVVRSADAVRAAGIAEARFDMLEGFAARLDERGVRDREASDRMRRALAERSFEAYSAIFLRDGKPNGTSPTKGARKDDPFLDRFIDAEHLRLEALHRELCAISRFEESAAALVLAHGLDDAYAAAKQRAGVMDFDDLIERANALLGLSDAAPWVLFKLDQGISHILVDEGQDTSPAQWSLLEPLQSEFFAGEGAARADVRTVFAVGDHKQSIYGFQGADPDHFLNEAQRLSSRAAAVGAGFDAPTLFMSFRSTAEVLRLVDATFEGRALGRAEPAASEILRHDAHRIGEGGLVELWPLAPKPEVTEHRPWDTPLDAESETSAAARLAKALAGECKRWIETGEAVWEKGALRPMRAGDILVLVRSRGPLFNQIIKAFKRVGLPVAGADRVVLKEEIGVMDLLAAARVALNPSDDLSLATVLKSPLIGLVDDDTDIYPLAYGRAPGERLIDRLRDAPDRYEAARRFVADLCADANAHPHAFFSRLLERLDASGTSRWERMFARLGYEARDPLEEFLARAAQIDRDSPATLQHFVNATERDASEVKRELEHAADAVRIMTVHGAKGLEAPVVLLPDAAAGPKNDTSRGALLWREDGPLLCGSKDSDDSVAHETRAQAQEATAREHLRLLYVALTRARDRLIVCGAVRGNGKSGCDADAWWPSIEVGMARCGAQPCPTPFGEGLRIGSPLQVGAVNGEPPARGEAPAWARRPVARSPGPARDAGHGFVLSPRSAGRARFRRGLLIHGLLQRLPDVEPTRRMLAGAVWLERQGAIGDEAKAYLDEANAVLAFPALASAFGPGSRAEAPLVARLSDGTEVRGVVDRLAVSPTEVIVLDYKTDRPPPQRVEDTPARILQQMAGYRDALRQIFPERRVRAWLVWTEQPLVVELPGALLDRYGA